MYYEIEAASVLELGNPCQSYFSRICFVYVARGGTQWWFFLRLSVFLCIYKQTSVSCAAFKSWYFWFWIRFNSEHKFLPELSHFLPLPGETLMFWSELTRSEVCCIVVITSLNERGWSLFPENLCYRPRSLHCNRSHCTFFFPLTLQIHL